VADRLDETDFRNLMPVNIDKGYPEDGPLRKASPLLRMSALADYANIHVFDIPGGAAAGLSGAVAVVFDKEKGGTNGAIGLAADLDEDLRTDVLAFAMAVYIADTELLMSQPEGRLGIGRKRLEPAKLGAGRLAYHMVLACGRNTPSATFDLEPI
jgi:hypothetical protein